MFLFPLPPVPDVFPGDLPAHLTKYDAFAPQELDRINELARGVEERPVTVGNDNRIDPQWNRSRFRLLYPNREFMWIFERLAQVSAIMNSRSYRFDIVGFDQPLYHITYPGEDRGFYDWHADTGGDEGSTRKLSITLQLSDESDYEGGNLEINSLGTPVVAPKRRGALIVFPSYHVHRVAPVTRGERIALVAWIVGPPFR